MKARTRCLSVVLFALWVSVGTAIDGQAQNSILPKVDVFFLVDLSGSFFDDLPNFKSAAPEIVSALVTAGLDVNFGLGRFEDYPISPFGDLFCGDVAYARVLDISSPLLDANSNGVPDIIDRIIGLFTRCGADGPQSQLPALFQAATGAGQDLSPAGFPAASIPSSQRANFRSGSLPVIILWTDAVFHRPGDPGSLPYPGPSFATALDALNTRGIKVIGIGVNAFGNTLADLATIVEGTGTLAPEGGVDCDGNGTVDVAEGAALVCPISAAGTGIGQAIINTVKAASIPAQLAANRRGTPRATNPAGFSQEPVNTATGNYVFARVDVVIPGRGTPVVFQRTYNSQDTTSGSLGVGWTHSYNIILEENPDGSVVVKWGDGHLDFFDQLPGGAYVSRFNGVFDSLEKEASGAFRILKKDQTAYHFDLAKRLNAVVDRNGNIIVLGYDGSGNLTTITDTVGRVVVLYYDGAGRLSQLVDPLGRIVRYGYDADGNLASVTDPNGGVTTLAYDADLRIREIRDERGNVLIANEYDAAGRVISQINGRGFTTTFDYGVPAAGDTTITDPLGNTTIHTHDAQFRLLEVIDANGNIVGFTYDADNNRTSITDKNGHITSFTYDGEGNVTSITDPLSNLITFTYDGQNNLTSAANARGFTTLLGYDPRGNLTTIQDALGNITNFVYDGTGQVIQKTDARGNVTQYAYDGQGNLAQIADALGGKTTLAYDGIGRLQSLTDPNGDTAGADYDALSRLREIVDPLGSRTGFTYDPVGNLVEILDAKGNRTQYTYDEVNNLTVVTDALGQVTQYAYDENNNRTALTNANGQVTTYVFDALNRLAQITDPLGNATTYGYDPVGNVASVTDANGVTNTFSYDANNRLIGIAYGDGTAVTYSYDANGNRVSMVDARGTTTYTYDALDRLGAVDHPASTVGYSYDSVGNRINLTLPDGKAVTYSYDALNRLNSLIDWRGRMTSYAYDAASNLREVLYPNQTAISYEYDAANRLVELVHQGRRLLARFSYTLDELGNRIQMAQEGSAVDSRTTFGYTYDVLSQLVAVEEFRRGQPVARTVYTYDPVGNRLSLTEFRLRGPHGWVSLATMDYTYDAADRLLQAGDTVFTYDANGNRLTEGMMTGPSLIYTYDAANRLIRVARDSSETTYTYDGDGNKVGQAIVNGTTIQTFRFLNDVATALPVVLREEGPDEAIDYIYGLGLIAEEVTRTKGRRHDDALFYHADGLGSTKILTDGRGRPKAHYEYDAWGNLEGSRGRVPNRFLFTGEEEDPETGLYYLRARWYDPGVGRFLTKDPVAGTVLNPAASNTFSYASNNPVRYTDPTGTGPQSPVNFQALPGTEIRSVPPAFEIRSAPDAQPMTLEEIRQWTANNRIRVVFGVDPGVVLVEFLGGLMSGEVKFRSPFFGKQSQVGDPERERALGRLSRKCYPLYETMGFSYVNPQCG